MAASGRVLAAITDGSTVLHIASSTPVDDNAFHHVAVVFDRDATATVYVDGVPEGSVDISSVGDVSNTGSSIIGRGNVNVPGSAHKMSDGIIDELAVYNRTLSAGEIQAIFAAGSAGKCKDEDGDGFRPPDDCDETDPDVNPEAVEIIFNFVDENCDGDLGDCGPCSDWRNHGQYVRCVSDAVSDCSLHSFTPEEADALVSSAVHSDIGKTGYVPPECPQP